MTVEAGRLSQQEKQLLTTLLSNPLEYPEVFKDWLPQFVALSGLDIPISQVVGFSHYTANVDSVATKETTSSTSYTDLTTVGPEISGLPDGKYLLLFGCIFHPNGGTLTAYYAPNINGTADDADSVSMQTSAQSTIVWALQKTLQNNNDNTIKMQYKRSATATSVDFQNRFLVAIKFANA